MCKSMSSIAWLLTPLTALFLAELTRKHGLQQQHGGVTDGGALTRLKANLEFKIRHPSNRLIIVR